MPYEMLAAVFVHDADEYAAYRNEIAPLLRQAGASFQLDCELSRVLSAERQPAVNRLFLLRFPNRAAKEELFTSHAYQAIRDQRFMKATRGLHVLAEYELHAQVE